MKNTFFYNVYFNKERKKEVYSTLEHVVTDCFTATIADVSSKNMAKQAQGRVSTRTIYFHVT